MAYGDGQAGFGGQSSEVGLPRSDAVSVGSAGVGGDQKPGGVAEAVLAHLVPPAADRVGGELGGVGGVAY